MLVGSIGATWCDPCWIVDCERFRVNLHSPRLLAWVVIALYDLGRVMYCERFGVNLHSLVSVLFGVSMLVSIEKIQGFG